MDSVTALREMDIFHPLSSIQWEKHCQLQNVSNANCIFLEGKLYVGGGYTGTDGSKILVSSPDFINWSTMETPTREQHFALTTFKSQLVLVGGKCMKYKPATVSNKLWTRNVNVWEERLPPMQEERYWPSAINVSSPTEAIVVAGGRGSDGRVIDSVEVLLEEQWHTVQSLPKKCYGTKAIIFNERLYLVGGTGLGCDVYFCRLDMITDKETMESKKLWTSFGRTPSEASYVGSFQHELIAVMAKDGKLLAYHAFTKSWLHVGDTPTGIRVGALPISLANGNMVVIGTSSAKEPSKLFMISLKVSPYDPDFKFSRCSLSRIEEGAGIQVIAPLSKVHTLLMSATGVEVSLDHTFSDEGRVEKVIGEWAAGKCHPNCPPTWKSLISVLKRLDLAKVAQQIEDHLKGMRSNALYNCT